MHIMSKTRSMYAGSSGYNYGANKNSPGNGNGKWQGLWPSVGHARNARHINIEAGGNNRNVVFCMNQLGGVGRISTMFATTADGVKEPCSGFGHNNNRGPYPIKSGDTLTLGYKSNSVLQESIQESNQETFQESFQIPLTIPLQCVGIPNSSDQLSSLDTVFHQIPKYSILTNNTIEETRTYLSSNGMISLDNATNLDIIAYGGTSLNDALTSLVISANELFISRINNDGSIPKSQSSDFSDFDQASFDPNVGLINGPSKLIITSPLISVKTLINSNVDKLFINNKEVTNKTWYIASLTGDQNPPEIVKAAFASLRTNNQIIYVGNDDSNCP